MATVLTETDIFTGSVTVPDPGDARNAASVITGFQALTNRTKNLKGRLDAMRGTRELSNMSFCPAWDTAATSPMWILNNAGVLISRHTFPFGWRPLDDALINGATIHQCAVRVVAGAARATSSNRINARLMKRQAFTAASSWVTVGASNTDDGTATEQTITVTPDEVVDLTQYTYAIRVVGGSDADTNIDFINGFSVTLT